jgi:hypothetical protein
MDTAHELTRIRITSVFCLKETLSARKIAIHAV